MDKNNLVPTQIRKSSNSEMTIAWNNGEVTPVSFFNLRFHCRCAECVDEWTRERRLKAEQIRTDIMPLRVEPVGRYAVQIEWNDKHKTGIYPYDLLYQIALNKVPSEEKDK
ncbi:MAG: DUF971 domain-containing protein [Bdellovibrionota bacterium]